MDLPTKTRHLVAWLTTCRLCRRITFVVFAAIFLVEAAILVPSFRNYQHDLLKRLEDVGRTTIVSAYISVAHSSERDLLTVGGKLSRRSMLRGGALYAPDGRLIGHFGEPPALGLRPTPEQVIESRRSDDGKRLEVIWPRLVTGLPFTVVGRIDSSDIRPEMIAFLWRIGGLVLIISAFVSAVTILILGKELLSPLLNIRRKLTAVGAAPAQADRHIMKDMTDDELGDVIGALNDLFRRVAKTHREELATMLAMVEGSTNGLIALDPSGKVVYANDAVLRLCGVERASELHSEAAPRLARMDRQGTLPLKDVMMAGPFTGEARLMREHGEPIPCLLRCSTLPEADGKPLRYLAALTDISELHAAYESLERQNEELSASNRAKSEFVANVSHELRTPLNAIIGFSELMLIRGHGQIALADYDQYVGSIHSSGAHLLSVINDILDLSKIEAGMLVLAENDVDPKAVITGSMNFVTEKAAEAGVTLSDRTAAALPGVYGDSRKLTQVLTNLLANAVKFTPEGGRVEIEAGTRDDGSFWISVSDTGIGIPQEDIGRVFEPFVQVDGSLNRKFDGTGLGLPLSKALIELHGGTLSVTSVVDAGTTATIDLPGSRIRARIDVAAG